MATLDTVATGLALLHEAFPTRDITDETAPAWALIFRDVPDEKFTAACVTLSREPGRTFFPTTGELSALLAGPPPNAEELLDQIGKMGVYNPHCGVMAPPVATVRHQLGEHVAYAYGMAGAGRLFADNEISRDNARRDFAKALAEPPIAVHPLLPAPVEERVERLPGAKRLTGDILPPVARRALKAPAP